MKQFYAFQLCAVCSECLHLLAHHVAAHSARFDVRVTTF